MGADFRMGRARHRGRIIHLFLLLFLGYTSARAQISEIYYSNCPEEQFFKPFETTTLKIDFSPATGLASNGSGLCLTQSIPMNTGERSESAGRALYRTPVQIRDPATKIVNSFTTMFSFWIESNSLYSPGHGLAFVLAPDNSSSGSPGMYLGWLNESTKGPQLGNFAVEFDTVQNEEFDDPSRYHVGVNVNSLRSICTSEEFGYHKGGEFRSLKMTTDMEKRIYVWIEYDPSKNETTVTVSPSRAKPERPLLICASNLSDYIQSDKMFVGFTASTGYDSNGEHLSQHTVYEWSFGTAELPPVNLFGDARIRSQRLWPSKQALLLIYIVVPCGVFVVAAVVFGFRFALLSRRQTHAAPDETKRFQDREFDTLESVRGPEKFSYKELSLATKAFCEDACIGGGGFGKVYRGVIPKRSGVLAVKRISKTSHQGAQEFAAEVKIIGCVQHRNLVPLLGWCHDVVRDELLLVYEFMPNGSLDRFLFNHEAEALAWDKRLNILRGVGSALAFLHEEWEHRVVHRDVKAGNVMLDANFNARLGDFGLARLYDHSQGPMSTLNIAGTVGYMAPELVKNRTPTEKTDVYSFGAVALEVATGIRASSQLTDRNGILLDWVWALYGCDRLLEAADTRLEGEFDVAEMALVLKVGLVCSHPEADCRPTMRQSLAMLKGEVPVPLLPPDKPLPAFARSMDRSESLHNLSRQ